MTPDAQAAEAQISALVERFYQLAGQDALLGPVFAQAIADLPAHLVIVKDFWSHALLGTKRYGGSPFRAHLNMPGVELEHFDRWLVLFAEAAEQTLPPDLADMAKARARHMSESIKTGLFPWKTPDGKLSRHRPPGL